jgi:hypothetical protein
MEGTTDIFVTWVLPSMASLLLLVYLRTPTAGAGGPTTWLDRGWIPLFILSRVFYALLLFGLFNFDSPSDSWAWKLHSQSVLDGLMPGRDFENLYSPLFHYLLAAGRFITPGQHWLGTLLPFVIGDFLAILYGGRIGRNLLGEKGGGWVRAWLLVTPLLWHQLVVRGQDESLFLGLLLLALWLAHRERPIAVGLVLALGLTTTKVTFAPYALGLLLAMPGGRLRAILAFSLPTAVVYGAYVAAGGSIFPTENLSAHQVNFGAGISIPDALARVFPTLPYGPMLSLYAGAMVLAAVVAPLLFRGGSVLLRGTAVLTVVHALSMLTMPFCVSPYIAEGVALPLLLFASLPADRRSRAVGLTWLIVLGFLATLAWTKCRVFSVPLKPLSISFHLFAVWVAIRCLKEAKE